MIALLLAMAIQSDRLPPANPLPPPGTEAAGVMRPITAMMDGMAAGNDAAILAQVRPDGGITVASENADGTHTIRHATWPEFAAALKPVLERHEERLGDIAIDIDGDIAMLWAPYVSLTGERIDHCGTDHFDLIRENGRWRIVNLTQSRRVTGCDAG